MCRSESPINRPFTIIGARFVIVPAERHIGRSLRALSDKFQFAVILSVVERYIFAKSGRGVLTSREMPVKFMVEDKQWR